MHDMHEKILAQIANWRRQLLDLSKRNRLISCPIGSASVIDLAHPDVETIWRHLAVGNGTMQFVWKRDLFDEPAPTDDPAKEPVNGLILLTSRDGEQEDPAPTEKVRTLEECLASPRLAKTHLLTKLTDRVLASRLNRLAWAADTALTEQGVNVLFLTFGFLKWQETSDQKKDLFAPLMLTPVELERVGIDGGWKLAEYEDEVVENLCLTEKMRAEFGIQLPPFPEDGLEAPGGRHAYFDRVRDCLQSNPSTQRWEVVDGALLGTFGFQKIAMWRDLGDNAERIATHPLCRAIAGDLTADPVPNVDLPPIGEFDERVHPRELHTIMDCDSSQLEAIYAVKKGLSLVLDGPPGTGKSQTIANLIAEFLADGRTVLFVSEKMAALEVVKRRLDLAGLGDFVLECHSHAANKKEIIQELGRCLELPQVRNRDDSELLERLFDERRQLNAYVEALHTRQSALRVTPFDVHTKLAVMGAVPSVDWTDDAVLTRDSRWLEQATQCLSDLVNYADVIEHNDQHPWQKCRLSQHSHRVEDDLRRLLMDVDSGAKAIQSRCDALVSRGLMPDAMTPSTMADTIRQVARALEWPQFPESWFSRPLSITVSAIRSTREALRRQQSARQRLAEFGDDGLTGSLHLVLESLRTAGTDSLAHLKPNAHGTLRSHAMHLQGVIERVTNVGDCLVNLTAALDEFGVALGFPFAPTTPPLVVERLAELGKVIGSDGHLRSGWFDKERREELDRVSPTLEKEERALSELAEGLRLRFTPTALAGSCDRWRIAVSEIDADDWNAARAFQERLRSRFSAMAFTPEGEIRADEAVRHRTTFSRLFGSWKAVRGRVHELYATSPPVATAQLLADMEGLQEFHRKHRAVWQKWTELHDALSQLYVTQPPESPSQLRADLQAIEAYQERKVEFEAQIEPVLRDLPKGVDGYHDWARLLRGIQSLAELDALGLRISDRLRQVLSSPGIFQPAEVAHAAEELAIRSEELMQAVDGLKGSVALGRIGEGQIPFNRCGLTLLQEWCDRLKQGLRSRSDAVEKAVLLLKADADLPLSKIDDRLAEWAVYDGSHSRLVALWTETSTLFGDAAEPVAVDWDGVESLAARLAEFAETYGDTPPPPLVSIVTNAEHHGQVAAELKLLEQALASWNPLWHRFAEAFDISRPVANDAPLEHQTFAELADWSSRRLALLHALSQWIRFQELLLQIEALGISAVLEAVKSGRLAADQAGDAFLGRFYRLWIDQVTRQSRALHAFEFSDHERLITRFRELDTRSIARSSRHIAERLLAAPGRPQRNQLAPKDSEIRTLMHQASLKRRHWPLRRLFAHIPTVLPRVKPCIMMSPLAVSTYLDSPRIQFDVVIFDEASQIRPFDAIGAIYRGKQLVVAGDPRQLPPTSFFDKLLADSEGTVNEDGDDLLGRLDDFESILDVCTSIGLPRRRLCWHYRSRREPLIAFSNRHFYDSDLVTFPSVFDVEQASPVRMEYCEEGRWKTGKTGGYNPVEVCRVAELVLRHFRETPRKSLGIITFNQRQQLRLMEELDLVARQHPELAGAIYGEGAEPLFVKNLENVQGDERDRIIISVAYGFDENGKFAMRFGPLNQQGGERRLNVAITRAREEIVVVSSIRADHVSLAKTQARGVHLLKAYLDFAERGSSVDARADEDASDVSDHAFVAEVERSLRERGYLTHRRIGCGSFKVDLALLHPGDHGRYVMGIECDGPSYRQVATARDRDRLRDQVLRSLGWGVGHIWSADWLSNREGQLNRIDEQFQRLLIPIINPEPETLATEPPEDDDAIEVEYEIASPSLRLTVSLPPTAAPVRRFSKIDDVPDGLLNETILDLIQKSGRSPEEGIVRSVAYTLGFNRVGRKIEERIKWSIKSLVRKRQVLRDEERFLLIR